MSGAIHPLPQYVFMAWCLVKHRDNFTFYLLPFPVTISSFILEFTFLFIYYNFQEIHLESVSRDLIFLLNSLESLLKNLVISYFYRLEWTEMSSGLGVGRGANNSSP
jgi:hypothetical protein